MVVVGVVEAAEHRQRRRRRRQQNQEAEVLHAVCNVQKMSL